MEEQQNQSGYSKFRVSLPVLRSKGKILTGTLYSPLIKQKGASYAKTCRQLFWLSTKLDREKNRFARKQLKSDQGADQADSKATLKLNRGLRDQIRYENIAVLNESEACSVNIKRDAKTGDKVVIKTYYKYKFTETKKKNFVTRQLNILKKVKHKRIIRLIHSFTTKFAVNLVFEFMPFNLTHFLDSHILTVENKLRIFWQVVEGVEYMHRLNLIHRDIKTDNILINQSHQIKIIDFGFSSHDCESHTMYLGTLPYMSPEILSKKPYKGKPADVWALGVMLYFMMKGELPFKGRSQKEVLGNIKLAKFEGKRDYQRLIERMLKIQAEQRPSLATVLSWRE